MRYTNFTDILKNIMETFKEELLDEGSTFVSEADFKYNLAIKLYKTPNIKNIVLEFPEGNKYVDLYCEYNNTKYYVEFKYKTKEIEIKKCGQIIKLKSHSAQNDNRYLLYKDIERLENFIKNKNNAVGIALFLTNDANYWGNNTPASAINFPLYKEKTNLKNLMCDECNQKTNCNDKNKLCYLTKKKEEKKPPIKINSSYDCKWTTLGEIKCNKELNKEFRYLLIEVKNKNL